MTNSITASRMPQERALLDVASRRIAPLVVVWRWWWHSDKSSHRTCCSADGGTKGCTVPTTSGSPDCSTAARANETATDRPLTGSYGLVQAVVVYENEMRHRRDDSN
jgi:hypothetical protein